VHAPAAPGDRRALARRARDGQEARRHPRRRHGPRQDDPAQCVLVSLISAAVVVERSLTNSSRARSRPHARPPVRPPEGQGQDNAHRVPCRAHGAVEERDRDAHGRPSQGPDPPRTVEDDRCVLSSSPSLLPSSSCPSLKLVLTLIPHPCRGPQARQIRRRHHLVPDPQQRVARPEPQEGGEEGQGRRRERRRPRRARQARQEGLARRLRRPVRPRPRLLPRRVPLSLFLALPRRRPRASLTLSLTPARSHPRRGAPDQEPHDQDAEGVRRARHPLPLVPHRHAVRPLSLSRPLCLSYSS